MGTQSFFLAYSSPYYFQDFSFSFSPKKERKKEKHTFLTESLKHNAFHKGAHMPDS
jgi:hypothetical protein